jgi:hypothetical protein
MPDTPQSKSKEEKIPEPQAPNAAGEEGVERHAILNEILALMDSFNPVPPTSAPTVQEPIAQAQPPLADEATLADALKAAEQVVAERTIDFGTWEKQPSGPAVPPAAPPLTAVATPKVKPMPPETSPQSSPAAAPAVEPKTAKIRPETPKPSPPVPRPAVSLPVAVLAQAAAPSAAGTMPDDARQARATPPAAPSHATPETPVQTRVVAPAAAGGVQATAKPQLPTVTPSAPARAPQMATQAVAELVRGARPSRGVKLKLVADTIWELFYALLHVALLPVRIPARLVILFVKQRKTVLLFLRQNSRQFVAVLGLVVGLAWLLVGLTTLSLVPILLAIVFLFPSFFFALGVLK